LSIKIIIISSNNAKDIFKNIEERIYDRTL